MRIAMVCPSNMLYMPYLAGYEKILEELGVNYDIINWDRFKIEEQSKFVYRDSKFGHQRGPFDYYKFSKFVLNLLKDNNYDKIIIFGIQIVYFTKRYLIKEYSNKYIIDIRDYNKIIKYFNIRKPIDNSVFTVLSSHGFKKWIPNINKYIINHNTLINSTNSLYNVDSTLNTKDSITINYIGSIRDYKINIDFINSVKNKKNINLNYFGEGLINKDLEDYLLDNNIENVRLTGRYIKEQEQELYLNSDIINILIPNTDINSKTLSPNRLYTAAIYGKPVIAFEGTYIAEIIKKYHLGLVINSFENSEKIIFNYIKSFDNYVYMEGRSQFLDLVLNENKQFVLQMKRFLNT